MQINIKIKIQDEKYGINNITKLIILCINNKNYKYYRKLQITPFVVSPFCQFALCSSKRCNVPRDCMRVKLPLLLPLPFNLAKADGRFCCHYSALIPRFAHH